MSVQNRLLKYAVHGGATYGALYYLSGGAKSVNLFGQDVPLVVAGVAMGVATSLVNDAVHTWILPAISKDKKLQHFEGIATSLAAGAAGTVGFAYLGNKELLNTPGLSSSTGCSWCCFRSRWPIRL